VSGLPETDVARVQRWCRDRVPEHVRDEVRVEVDVAERHLTIVECRPPWRADVGAQWTRFPIARLRYTKTTGVWSLYWRDRNLGFHAYDLVSATASIEELLSEVDRDPTAIFWGLTGPASYAVMTAALVIRSAGLAQPRVLRGRSLISSVTRCSSSGEKCARSMPLGK